MFVKGLFIEMQKQYFVMNSDIYGFPSFTD